MDDVRVTVCAQDPITRAGLVNCLQARSGVVVNDGLDGERTTVVVAAFDDFTPEAVVELRTVTAGSAKPVILLVDAAETPVSLAGAGFRVVAILPRAAASDDRLVSRIHAVAEGTSDTQADLAGQLLVQTDRLQRELLGPPAARASVLDQREIDVLRMMADGLATHEIARRLNYSDRTVKNIVYTVTSRLRLRNRSHTVAYAIRAGII
ncbi:helix-turn-helix transcriptional regulator [Amycolatopsis balhimycina]|uniref:helix-turn-helix transcriptional regulator n=1 Tax=Amycolatopsis balhimycina TaxID=208443 RepID=UPI0003A1B2BB|nr:LuxR C-terminal-related transcriptional regulator [Amycolatopsis balhimycina]